MGDAFGTVRHAAVHGPVTAAEAAWVAGELRARAAAWEGPGGIGAGDGDGVADYLAATLGPDLAEAAEEQGVATSGEVPGLLHTLAWPWLARAVGAPTGADAREVLEALAEVFEGRRGRPGDPGPRGVFAAAAPAVLVRPWGWVGRVTGRVGEAMPRRDWVVVGCGLAASVAMTILAVAWGGWVVGSDLPWWAKVALLR